MKQKKNKARSIPKKKINLALQGGGMHSSFSWGVLDRLLEEPDFSDDNRRTQFRDPLV